MHSWMSCTSEKSRRAFALAFITAGTFFASACGEAASEEDNLITSTEELTIPNGLSLNGISLNGISLNGISLNGISLNGISLNGVKLDKTSFQLMTFGGPPMTGAGFVGAVFTGKLSNGQSLTLRIEDRVPSAQTDVFFYEISYRASGSGSSATWKSLCGTTPSGELHRAIPLAGVWDYSQRQPTSGMHITEPDTFTFACRGYAIAKCVELGYRPWASVTECLTPGVCKTISADNLHQACTRMLRADYCGDGVPHTKDGTEVDVWDGFGIQSPVDAGFSFEAEWTPTGARCIEHTRWLSDTGGSSAAYVDQRCPSRWASAQPTYECGGPNSTLHTKKGFSVPIVARSLIANESKDPND